MKKQNTWALYKTTWFGGSQRQMELVSLHFSREEARSEKKLKYVTSLYRVVKVEIKPLSYD